jgi:hypothetical protein
VTVTLRSYMPYARKDTIIWQKGMYYHIYNRGARQVTIFREETNSANHRFDRHCEEDALPDEAISSISRNMV